MGKTTDSRAYATGLGDTNRRVTGPRASRGCVTGVTGSCDGNGCVTDLSAGSGCVVLLGILISAN